MPTPSWSHVMSMAEILSFQSRLISSFEEQKKVANEMRMSLMDILKDFSVKINDDDNLAKLMANEASAEEWRDRGDWNFREAYDDRDINRLVESHALFSIDGTNRYLLTDDWTRCGDAPQHSITRSPGGDWILSSGRSRSCFRLAGIKTPLFLSRQNVDNIPSRPAPTLPTEDLVAEWITRAKRNMAMDDDTISLYDHSLRKVVTFQEMVDEYRRGQLYRAPCRLRNESETDGFMREMRNRWRQMVARKAPTSSPPTRPAPVIPPAQAVPDSTASKSSDDAESLPPLEEIPLSGIKGDGDVSDGPTIKADDDVPDTISVTHKAPPKEVLLAVTHKGPPPLVVPKMKQASKATSGSEKAVPPAKPPPSCTIAPARGGPAATSHPLMISPNKAPADITPKPPPPVKAPSSGMTDERFSRAMQRSSTVLASSQAVFLPFPSTTPKEMGTTPLTPSRTSSGPLPSARTAGDALDEPQPTRIPPCERLGPYERMGSDETAACGYKTWDGQEFPVNAGLDRSLTWHAEGNQAFSPRMAFMVKRPEPNHYGSFSRVHKYGVPGSSIYKCIHAECNAPLFTNESALKRHEVQAHRRDLICLDCGADNISTSEGLRRHSRMRGHYIPACWRIDKDMITGPNARFWQREAR